MITKSINHSIATARRTDSTLFIIVPQLEIQIDGILRIGFNHENKLQIDGFIGDELATYILSEKEILNLATRHNIQKITLALSEGFSPDSSLNVIFNGLLQLPHFELN